VPAIYRNKISPRVPSPTNNRSNDFHDDFVLAAIKRENNLVLDCVQAGVNRLEAQQVEFLQQQDILMKTLVKHMESLTESMSFNLNLDNGGRALAPAPASTRPPGAPGDRARGGQVPFPATATGEELTDIVQIQARPRTSYKNGGAVVPSASIKHEDKTEDIIELLRDEPKQEAAKADFKQKGSRSEVFQSQHLRVTVMGCTGLMKSDKLSSCEPYCICSFLHKPETNRNKFHTPVVKDTLSPEWKYTHPLYDYKVGDTLKFVVNDHEDFRGDVLLGEATLESSRIQEAGGFKGQLALTKVKQGSSPSLDVMVEVVEGPGPHEESQISDGVAADDLDQEAIKEEHQVTKGESAAETYFLLEQQIKREKEAVSKIPIAPLRNLLLRLVMFKAELREPERNGPVAKFEEGTFFFITSLLVVLADQVSTVVATNYAAANIGAELPLSFTILDWIFLIWFAFEVFIKIFVHRHYFFIGENGRMNNLDFFLVIYSSVEAIGLDLSFLRALRVFKLAKVIRMLKALSQVRDLRVMMDCLISSWFAMFWAIVLIGFLTYLFALIFVQILTEFVATNEGMLEEGLKESIMARFGSVELGILSLFMSLTGGFDWGEMYDVIVVSGPIGTVACLFFVLFFTISVWNIVGSIFVEKVMDTAKPRPHEYLQQMKMQDEVDAAEMKQFFADFDKDMDGAIQEAEWQKLVSQGSLLQFLASRECDLKDEIDVQAFFAMALDAHIAKNLNFNQSSNSIPVDALVSMFLKLKGQASAVDVAIMTQGVLIRQKLMIQMLSSLMPEAGDPISC
jgi:hypothetical protein